MTRAGVGAIGTVLWLLAIAIAVLEGWWVAWLVIGVGLGWYFRAVEIHAVAEIRRRDEIIARREWRSR